MQEPQSSAAAAVKLVRQREQRQEQRRGIERTLGPLKSNSTGQLKLQAKHARQPLFNPALHPCLGSVTGGGS